MRRGTVSAAEFRRVRAAIREEALDRFAAEFLTVDAREWLAGFAARAAVRALGLQFDEESS